MLEWYLLTMCCFTLQERRTELFKIINGDVFFPSKEWPLALRLWFWTKPLSDEDSFKMMLFLIGNGLAPSRTSRWVGHAVPVLDSRPRKDEEAGDTSWLCVNKSGKLKKKTTGCVAYTKGKPRNAIAKDIYSCICHGEQRGCHVVLLSSKIGSSLCPAKLRKLLSILWV